MERAWRLRKGLEFDTTYAKGTVTSGPLFVVRALPNGLDHPRWGFAVGKRIAKSAVIRNHTKRRLREAADALGNVGGFDLVITARARALGARWPELSTSVARQVRRATSPAPAASPSPQEPRRTQGAPE